MTKDTCIICGVETPYTADTHIDIRIGYIEGAGQLCKNCYSVGTDRSHTAIPNYFFENTPNDMDLGAKVRHFYYEQKKPS